MKKRGGADMAGTRQPIELLIAKGKKNLTKAEIAERRAREVKPCTDDITAPSCLTKAQAKRFYEIAGQLEKINLLGETDVDALARYVQVQSLYEQATKKLRAAMRTMDDPYELEQLSKLQDRYFRQADKAAAALGLTISSRCKLQVPVKEEAPKVNKFARFGEGA